MSNSVNPWDLLNPNKERSSEDLAKNRLDICKSCEHFIKLSHQCKKCGCFMNLKSKLKDATCPIGKW